MNADFLRAIIQLLRPKQWVKNAFVLAPFLFVGDFVHIDVFFNAVLACGLFCLASSMVYVLNDWHDIERDKLHPKKSKTRPLASGALNKKHALFVLCVLSVLLAWGYVFLPQMFVAVGLYLALNGAYSLYLKHQPVWDIFTVALGFVLRVWAGALALNVVLSDWMFITTLCLALFLVSVKRRQELKEQGSQSRAILEKYSLPLIDRYAEMSATGALLFYSLFVLSQKPNLALSIPLVLFGLFRYWYVMEIKNLGESPTDALFSDWQLPFVVLLWVIFCAFQLLGN